jgi:two-component system, cell cycle response regulator
MASKILTIDDSKMVRVIITKTFKALGCDIVEASNGTDGLAAAEKELPDLVFLDITMGDMTGLQVLEKMRQIDTLASTPVIMLTAESGSQSVEQAERFKVYGYVSKPFKSEQLVELATPFLHLQPVA